MPRNTIITEKGIWNYFYFSCILILMRLYWYRWIGDIGMGQETSLYWISSMKIMINTIYRTRLLDDDNLPSIVYICSHMWSKYIINSVWTCYIVWRHRSGSSLSHVMVCCLTASRRYLNADLLSKRKCPRPFECIATPYRGQWIHSPVLEIRIKIHIHWLVSPSSTRMMSPLFAINTLIILGLRPPKARRYNFVTTSFVDWALT